MRRCCLLAGRNTPIDEALFSIALIHAHFDNLARDYGKSLITLRKLIKDYPESPLAQQAKVIMSLIQNNERLNRRVERLNNIIDALQKADTGDRSEKGGAGEKSGTGENGGAGENHHGPYPGK